ncbi:hypothetical protein [Salinicoccus roseus]|uniref:hypothetical protein n=1 Tax=Salinicoccus roseus TaxID=45670 RepID=UPI00356AFD95
MEKYEKLIAQKEQVQPHVTYVMKIYPTSERGKKAIQEDILINETIYYPKQFVNESDIKARFQGIHEYMSEHSRKLRYYGRSGAEKLEYGKDYEMVIDEVLEHNTKELSWKDIKEVS